MVLQHTVLWSPGFLAAYVLVSLVVVLAGVGIAVLLMRSDV